MFGVIKKSIFEHKQRLLRRHFPDVNIVLHPDMPQPSMNKMLQLAAVVRKINSLETKYAAMSDAELKAKTEEFRQIIRRKEKESASEIQQLQEAFFAATIPEEKERLKERIKLARNKIFADCLEDAFALVREAAKRTIGLRHFDVQLAGGIVLHEGKIAEMATGEGKTLVATLPAYLNALLGRGVHIVTVNDYLARRDREWMGPIYEFLGLTVGAIQHEMSDEQRQREYACDITYGTNNEFGFDYLRDNMKYSLQDLVQRPFFYAIVDEVDSILIDEARTPLIISGPAEESTEKYYIVDRIVGRLKGRRILEREEIDAKYRGEDLSKGYDYIIDEKAHTAHLTEEGELKVARLLNIGNLSDMENIEWRHHIIQALRAHNLYQKDVDYVVKDGQVIIVDEFTGRLMPGRRWSDGLHQAVEAKEGLRIERENQTLATITFQNYFRMYEKLAGMTGTAFTEANEFKTIYQLDVVVIPTNRPLIRNNYPDLVFKTETEKFNAVVEEITSLYQKGQPVLVGTISIEKSERLSQMLKQRGIPHQVLNAKYHEMEATIVAQAGRYKAVTIATNMAGRGTDILLGGNPEFMAKMVLRQKMKPSEPDYQQEYKALLEKFKNETQQEHEKVVSLGGLHVLGTERHEARRIDNQLRGRCGRQGDPGSSRFYVSFEDDLMRLFAPEWMLRLLDTLDTQGQPLTAQAGRMAQMITKAIETAQRRIEQHNFEIRKQLLEYDNVMNKQREVIYTQRRQILEGESLKEEIERIIGQIVDDLIGIYSNHTSSPQDWDLSGLLQALKMKFALELSPEEIKDKDDLSCRDFISGRILGLYQQKERSLGQELMRHMERMVFLQVIDSKWKDHLYAMDYLREGIGLRAYGQRDPLVEYKREAFSMFSAMISTIEQEAVELIFRLQPLRSETMLRVFNSERQNLLHPQVLPLEERHIQDRSKDTPVSSPSSDGTFSDAFRKKSSNEAPLSTASRQDKVGRNDPCPCGSGKKYKKCCGK